MTNIIGRYTTQYADYTVFARCSDMETHFTFKIRFELAEPTRVGTEYRYNNIISNRHAIVVIIIG